MTKTASLVECPIFYSNLARTLLIIQFDHFRFKQYDRSLDVPYLRVISESIDGHDCNAIIGVCRFCNSKRWKSVNSFGNSRNYGMNVKGCGGTRNILHELMHTLGMVSYYTQQVCKYFQIFQREEWH